MIALFIGIGVVLVCVIMATEVLSLRDKNDELAARKERLEEQLEEQQERQEDLDDEEDYVKTTEYIEEKAKEIGYVYPDEIIFKREN